ncbi:MAG: hypothetical protein HYR71_13420 [Chloroflexi bacterium]|nr:hypothetical protein [Chloroflexota bacterium]
MTAFLCPYLEGEVELTDEREQHIASNHPDLLPEYRALLGEVLADPDQVRRSARFSNARLFSRRFATLRGGKHVVIIVVSDAAPAQRYWIITAYIARKLAEGIIEWHRP